MESSGKIGGEEREKKAFIWGEIDRCMDVCKYKKMQMQKNCLKRNLRRQ